MKTYPITILIAVIISLSAVSVKANSSIKYPYVDTICCSPDSLKVVSKIFPVFCVAWKVSADSNCIQPYGFEIEWSPFPGSTWTTKTVIYTGGQWVTFCDSVPECRSYQWRVRTICIVGDIVTYSNWIGGPKFAMICGDAKFPDGSKDNPGPAKNKPALKAEY